MVCAITYFIVNTSLVVGAIAVTSSVRRRGPGTRNSGGAPRRTWSPPSIAGLVALAITNGVFVLLPIVASPLYVCYRGYQRRWSEMATALLNRAAQSGAPATA